MYVAVVGCSDGIVKNLLSHSARDGSEDCFAEVKLSRGVESWPSHMCRSPGRTSGAMRCGTRAGAFVVFACKCGTESDCVLYPTFGC
jgi:hypothetical protein